MKRFISAASIGQFREVVASVNRAANFAGLDDNGEAIYDPSLKKPIILFSGTCKLHGTFSGVCYNEISGVWYQSKNEIITPTKGVLYKISFEDETDIIVDSEDDKYKFSKNILRIEEIETHDNAGFAWFAESKKEILINLIKDLSKIHSIDLGENTITLGMEWAGQGIQKGVGITNLEKSAFIFPQAKVSPFDKKGPSYWISTDKVASPDNRIYNTNSFKTFSIEVDFSRPQLSQNKIIEMTIDVENECPVSKDFGYEGIGEGIVFSHLNEDGSRLIFKSKGELHSKSKVKTLKPVDDEKVNKIIQIAEKVTPNWRLEQMLSETFDVINGGVIDRKRLGDYLRAVVNDVVKEDSDIIVDSGLELKDVGKYISQIARDYFFEYEKNDLGV